MHFRIRCLLLLGVISSLQTLRGDPVPCVNGFAGLYPCHQVDLLAQMIPAHMGGNGMELNDIWGWTDPLTGTEYALVGLMNATAFVDLSTPTNPVYVGSLPTHTGGPVTWRDIKTYEDHAFVVADHSSPLEHGMQVFDLRQLRSVTNAPVTFSETAHYDLFSSAHNIVINEESGFAYAVGLDAPGTTCNGGLHMIDIHTPTNPAFAGCFSGDGYTHDAQAVIYHGPDLNYAAREIVFASNEDTLTIVDVTVKANPVMLSRTGYGGASYTHQCWLTEDHRHLLLNDEQDEIVKGYNTHTHIWSVENLAAPVYKGYYEHSSPSIDHNLYVRDRFAYAANYTAGLRILDTTRIDQTILQPVAYFDPHYTSDSVSFSGAWSVYPYFDSGIVVLSSIEMGLFVLRPRLEEIPDNRLDVHQFAAENPLVSTNCPSIQLVVENTGTNAAVDVQMHHQLTPYTLSLIDQFDEGDASMDFGGGSSEHVEFELPFAWLTLDAQGATEGWGVYTSRVIDAEHVVDWDQLAWKPALPYGKELVPGALSDIGYPGVPVFGMIVFHLHPTGGGIGKGKTGANLIFHLNESPATNGVMIADGSGRGNHGWLDTGIDTGTHSATGKFHSAITLDGDDRITFDTPLMYTNGLVMSFSCWVQTTSDGTLLAQTADGETNRFELAIVSNRLAWVRDDAIVVHGTNAVTDGEWHHLAASRGTLGDISLYVDGVADSLGVDTNSLLETNAVVGAAGTNDYFTGTMDELALYQVAFSENDVRELYARGVNRILFQVRAASEPTFAGIPFTGPGGEVDTYFSEGLNTEAGLPDLMLQRTSRYIQYRARFETDDAAYRPKLLNVRLGPEHIDPDTGDISLSQGRVTAYDPLVFDLDVIPAGSNVVIDLQICMQSNAFEHMVSEAELSWLSAVPGNSPLTNVYTVLVMDTDGDTVPDFADVDDDGDGIADTNDLPDLAVTSSVQPLQILDESALAYSLSVTNGGTDAAQAVVVEDLMPPNTQVLDYRLNHPQLVALYDFNRDELEEGGTVIDHSGHDRHGTVHTGLPGVDQSVSTAHGTGIHLDGVSDWVDLPSFDLSTNYTISMWIDLDNTADSGALLSKTDAIPSCEFMLGVFGQEYLVLIQSAGQRPNLALPGPQHLLVSIVESNGVSGVDFYKDGVFLSHVALPDVLGDVSGGLGWTIGKVATPSGNVSFIPVIVDHLSIFNTAFTPAQVARLYEHGPVGMVDEAGTLMLRTGPLDPAGVLDVLIDAEVQPGALGALTNITSLILLEPDASPENHSATNIVFVVDTDTDGIADFTDTDDDDDGQSDSDESISGTDTKDPASRLELYIRLALDQAHLGFDAVTGRTYQVEMRENIEALAWTLSQSNLVGNGWVEWPQTNANPRSFFRLGVEKQP